MGGSRHRPAAACFALCALAGGAVVSQTAPPVYDVAFVATRNGRTGIHAMRGDGSNIRLVADVGRDAILTASSWSPNGEKIAYLGPEKELGRGRVVFHFPLYVVNIDGTGRARLLEIPVLQFAWSPDSTRLAFESGFEDPNFVPPSPHSDGSMAVAVYVVSLENRRVTRLTPFNSRLGPVSWSADGRHLTFATDEVYVIDPDGTNMRQITKTGGQASGSEWSPRGDWIAFTAGERDKNGTDEGGLFVIRPDGSGLKRLRAVESQFGGWSPDGASVAVLRPESMLIEVEKGTSTRFALDPAAMDAMFTPDGKSLLYRVAGGKVCLLDLRSQTQRELIQLVDGWSFTVSPVLRRPPGEPEPASIAAPTNPRFAEEAPTYGTGLSGMTVVARSSGSGAPSSRRRRRS